MAYPEPLERLIEAFERFPGVGRRTAERHAFHVLRDARAAELARAIDEATARTLQCGECNDVSATDPCALCADGERDATTLMVVEEPRDVAALEKAGVYAGRYHVLLGAYDPGREGDRGERAVQRLVERVRAGGVREVILGTDPDSEGEATALRVLEALAEAGLSVRVTRLARGLPAGAALEYLHKGVLEDALAGRVPIRVRRS